MKAQGKIYRTIWIHPENPKVVQVIDQRFLPHQFIIKDLATSQDVIEAIRNMTVRGAPLIGVTAAYGIYLILLEAKSKTMFESFIQTAIHSLKESRPTAVNLRWAVECQLEAVSRGKTLDEKIGIALETARKIEADDVEACEKIGRHGLELIEAIAAGKKGKPVNILTHCNAGWLACVDWGTATAPIYQAFRKGIPIHVWVDETRPRNQGASLTAWELGEEGVPYTVITDNTGGHLMQHGKVDLVIVGSDRTTRSGDVANKIGTYLKALAAKDNKIPFYAAMPASTIDWSLRDGVREIPIEERDAREVKYIQGMSSSGPSEVLLTPANAMAANYAFDVTPARLVTGIITERGIAEASENGLLKLFPEKA